MRMQDPSRTIGRAVRLAAWGAGVLLLAGCATGYSFVQPDMAGGGSYYTSIGPYSSQGSLDYATGTYYPGSAGWGYYNGAWPYWDPFGWYGGYGYGPSFTFGLGISNGWGFPGYWGPWYSTGYRWRCSGPGCASWRHRHRHGGHQHGNPDSPRPWLKPDHPPVPPQLARSTGSAPPVSVPGRPMLRRPALESPAFLPDGFVRAPIRRPSETSFNRMPMRPAYLPPMPQESAFANRRETSIPMLTPREMRPVAQPVFRSQPAPVAPVAAPPPHSTRASHTQIQ